MSNRAQPIQPIGPLQMKRNKYNVSAPADRTLDGKVYASKAEMIRAWELVVDEPLAVFEQVRVSLGCRENVFVVDFLVYDTAVPQLWAEEVKGVRTPKFNRDVKLWARYGPCPLHILTRKGDGWEREIIEPNPK